METCSYIPQLVHLPVNTTVRIRRQNQVTKRILIELYNFFTTHQTCKLFCKLLMKHFTTHRSCKLFCKVGFIEFGFDKECSTSNFVMLQVKSGVFFKNLD